MTEPVSIEQLCRDLLSIAIRTGLVSPSIDFANPDPQARTTGELVEMAHRLQFILKNYVRKTMTKDSRYQADRSECGVWMTRDSEHISVARAIAVEAMIALKLDWTDWRLRDVVINAISERVNKTLDFVQEKNNDTSTDESIS